MLAADASLQPLGALADRGHFSDAQTTLAAAAAVYSRCALTSTGSAERCSKAAAVAALLTALQQCSGCTDSKEKSAALAAAQRTAAAVERMPPASLRAPLCLLLLGGSTVINTSTTTATPATAAIATSSSPGAAVVAAAAVPVPARIVPAPAQADTAVMLPISKKAVVAGGDAPAVEPTAEEQPFARQLSKQHSIVAPDGDDAAAGVDYAFEYDDNDNTANAADADATTTDSTSTDTATSSSQEADAAAPASVTAVAAACVAAALRSAMAVAAVRMLLCKGSRISSRHRGGICEFAGTVQRVHVNGTFDVHYDDGEGELRCAAKHLKLLDAATVGDDTDNSTLPQSAVAAVAARALVYNKGSKVCVQGRFNSWPGTVLCSSSSRAGAYDIEYIDGVIEPCVPAHLLSTIAVTSATSATASSSSSSTNSVLCVGDRVEARYKGRERYYPGTITAVNAGFDSAADAVTYDIEYDDDEHESSVAAHLVQRGIPSVIAAVAESADSGTGTAAADDTVVADQTGKAGAMADSDSSMRIAEQLQHNQGVDSGG
jgi:hypothetical protein